MVLEGTTDFLLNKQKQKRNDKMSRIQLTDSLRSSIAKMSDGNPGSLSAMFALIQEAEEIDPQYMLGGLGYIMALDTAEIYGTHIYILWNDICGRDVYKLILLLRGNQLGVFGSHQLKELSVEDIYEPREVTDEMWQELQKKVCNQLPQFIEKELV